MREYQIEIIDVREHREEYVRIFYLYCQELLLEDPTIAQYNPEEPANESLQSTSHKPYLIMATGEVAGIVVFIEEEEIESNRDCHTYIGEIFIMSEQGPVNWGHCGICLGDGKVIQAWDVVRIDHYMDIENMISNAGERPKYLGWVPIDRVMAQEG